MSSRTQDLNKSSRDRNMGSGIEILGAMSNFVRNHHRDMGTIWQNIETGYGTFETKYRLWPTSKTRFLLWTSDSLLNGTSREYRLALRIIKAVSLSTVTYTQPWLEAHHPAQFSILTGRCSSSIIIPTKPWIEAHPPAHYKWGLCRHLLPITPCMSVIHTDGSMF